MSGEPDGVRCSDCGASFRFDRDLISGREMWFAPKKKRGGCQHPPTSVEVLVDGEWKHPAVVA